MLQLVYASRSYRPFTHAQLDALLARTRHTAARLGVTGLLVYHRETFLQVIEGPADAVNELYESIYEDPRHTNLVLVRRRPIADREFGGWDMGFVNTDRHDLTDLPGYAEYAAALSLRGGRVDSEAAGRMLAAFREPGWHDLVQTGDGVVTGFAA